MTAYQLAKDLNDEKDQTFDVGKIASISLEIKEKKAIYPIQVVRGEKGYRLIQGRHRIAASLLCGFKSIPYNE
ncbi:MAG: ParB N-terminal domain-containing protein [Paenibacillaceae bacterium]